MVYVCANAFVLVFSFFPPQTNGSPNRKGQIISALAGPIAGHSILAFGALWWTWDRKILPSIGYHFEASDGEIANSEILEDGYSESDLHCECELHGYRNTHCSLPA